MAAELAEIPAAFLLYLLEAATLVGDREAASVLFPRLVPLASIAHGSPATCPTCVARHLGAAAALIGEPAIARDYSEEALRVCSEMQFRPEMALTRLQLAEILLKNYRADRAAALDHLAFAAAELEAMGMQPALKRALRLGAGKRRPREVRPTYPDGLTEREVEVLRLIAGGMSNRQIADELVLSVRTVERHIANVYAKAGVRTKSQATAYALRNNLS